mmetsp:Transcript_83040/g.173851  ORF Transcript_83040/g.173851 Transcript_83040/m.173851 type:complete len:252 (+) Transcript_83040:124-879(+)|eukprot:CAMPEP_0206496516 /NCGR_PEP_ID=MMETSP0324_2-20121206/49469_1 /ASSEMBLY_ACC=CAM_ASM_000836 /TAXON_ID=2866 /ORGANISM="Crypthecodinium cohnii, Strain Seligo" /LENGTH=251 /DNA_ID=CAMNT_0053981575 /DNA_START=80 /DNA_END=835 /DNA_ORIENTATION=-
MCGDRPLLLDNKHDGRPAERGLTWGIVTFYIVLAVSFSIWLAVTIQREGLFPFRTESINWVSSWFWTTVGDYYVAASCLLGVVLSTERGWRGPLWSFAIFFLGSPFAALYVALRSAKGGAAGMKLRSSQPGFNQADRTKHGEVWIPAIYACLGLLYTTALATTLWKFPLLPFQPSDLPWAKAWLWTTLGDFYVLTSCLCGLCLASEGFVVGSLLSLTFLFLGSPCVCCWMVWRLLHHGSLTLQQLPTDYDL